jgi:hypothetical protein
MSRSFRKTPILPVTSAASDKPFKEQEHRRERRAVKIVLETRGEVPHRRTYGDPWRGDKDGKRFLDEPAPRDMRK